MLRYPFLTLLVAVCCTATSGAASATGDTPLQQDAYVWQRHWDADLVDGLAASRDLFAELRVLAAQYAQASGWVDVDVDTHALAADGRTVTLVARFEGSSGLPDPAPTAARLSAMVARWTQAGLRVRGIEIDHDCATARLPDYAQWLARLHRQLPASLRLSVTALPAWRDAPALADLLGAADASVLQVHAVQSATKELFDVDLARRWVADWSRRSAGRPYFVALPAYGLRVHLDVAGDFAGVEAEQPVPRNAHSYEIAAKPADVAQLLGEWATARPAGLEGVVWFRLPRASDRRAWPLATLRAVVSHTPLSPEVVVDVKRRDNGAADIGLRNAGTADAALPLRLETPDCAYGDGANGYRYIQRDGKAGFERIQPGTLRAGSTFVVGWLRCIGHGEINVHIAP